ncbi:TetR/AcrR family transcriptional regulator [Pseudobutyrivibrio sp.]
MEKTRKTDRRTLYTRTIIKEAFLKLIGEMPYDKINVSKICTEAEVSRATFYLHYDNIDCVLDSVLDDALLFSESGEGNFIDLINTVGKKEVDINEPILPACQRIADSDKYHDLFMDSQISDHIIHKIGKHEHDAVIPELMKRGNMNESEAEMVFKFILHGSFAVNRTLGWNKNDSWYKFQHLISNFVNGGLNNI